MEATGTVLLVSSSGHCPYPYLRHHTRPNPKPKLPPFLFLSLRSTSCRSSRPTRGAGAMSPRPKATTSATSTRTTRTASARMTTSTTSRTTTSTTTASSPQSSRSRPHSPRRRETSPWLPQSIDDDEFHKISLLTCDFFIRKVPDADDDVFDFREMYVTPPDTDIYSIPRVLAPMPQKYERCTKKNFGRYNVTEPPVEHLYDPLHKTEWEVMKKQALLDFEEIYVIDSKTRQSQELKLWFSVPEGKKRDRRNDLLLVRDGGESFRIIDKTKRDDAPVSSKEKSGRSLDMMWRSISGSSGTLITRIGSREMSVGSVGC